MGRRPPPSLPLFHPTSYHGHRMITVRYEARGRARRFVDPPAAVLELGEPLTAGDLMTLLGISRETAIRPVIDGTAVPSEKALRNGMTVTFVVLVTAG